jgi:hypothetical protein
MAVKKSSDLNHRDKHGDGFRDSLPELDWSLILVFRDRRWIVLSKFPGKKLMLSRLALPSRTAHHNQAAVRAPWSPGNETVLFAFRKVKEKWKCAAASDEKSRSHVTTGSRWYVELEGIFIGLELERHEQSLLRVD